MTPGPGSGSRSARSRCSRGSPVCEAQSWVSATEKLRRRLQVASMLGQGFSFSPDGVVALHGLLTEMAQKLDRAVEMGLAEPADRA